MTVLIRKKLERTSIILRRVVPKRALMVVFEEELRTEINCLKVHLCFSLLAMLSSYK